jgi:transposase
MLTFGPRVRVYVAPGATNMQRSFDGLAALARNVVGADLTTGHVFAFCNRRRNIVKLLVWGGDSFWVHAKRLEKGTFAWPVPREGERELVLSAEELTWILGGLDLREVRRRKWYGTEPRRAS